MKADNLPNNNDRAREYLNAQFDCLIEIHERVLECGLVEAHQINGLVSNMMDEITKELE